MHIHTHGTSGPVVIVLHGGPAAVGEAAPIAHGLADSYRVLEPWQRGSGGEPLTVARHVTDLHELVELRGEGGRPALVGESWGAMLALAYAAAHPSHAGPIVLVGCGTFDPLARAKMRETLDDRTDDELRRRLACLQAEVVDPDERLAKAHELMQRLFVVDPVEQKPAASRSIDARAHTETWDDMLRLQREGVYPAAFAAVESPVLMLHGADDPHPGRLILASLQPYLPRIEYHEWERCGHCPWLERGIADDFFKVMRGWLARHLGVAE